MGISPQNITDEPDVTAPPASGWLPGIEGLHIGKVKQLKGDPAGELRILVDIPVLNGDKNGIWARWATLYAGKDRGHFFLPEPDDEVVVGLLITIRGIRWCWEICTVASKPHLMSSTTRI